MLAGDGVLELVVVNDPSLLEVHEEHAPGLKAPLQPDLLRWNIEHPDLACHDHHIVVGDVVAARAQTVTVEQRTHHGAVGKRNGGRAVPGLHRAAHVLVHVAPGIGHLPMVLPGLGHHHHDRFGQFAAGKQQELESVVEIAAVGAVRLHNRERTAQVLAEEITLEGAFAGIHFVHVPAQRVDLAVVAHEAQRLRAIPAGERVGGKARVYHRHVGFVVRVAEIGIVRKELLRHEHTLVDEYTRGETADVEHPLRVVGFATQALRGLFSNNEELPIEVRRIGDGRGNESLLHCGLCCLRRRPDHTLVAGHGSPSEKGLPFLGNHLLEDPLTCRPLAEVAGQEDHAGGVAPARGQIHCEVPLHDLLEEPMRESGQNAGTVTGILLAPHRAAVRHVDENRFRLLDDFMAGPALYVSDKTDTARVMFERGIVESLLARPLLHIHAISPSKEPYPIRLSRGDIGPDPVP